MKCVCVPVCVFVVSELCAGMNTNKHCTKRRCEINMYVLSVNRRRRRIVYRVPRGVLPCAGKNTSPCGFGLKGVPGSDRR